MTKEQIYNILQDIADDASVTVEELVDAIRQQSNSHFEKSIAAMPEESANYVRNAKKERLAAREARRKAEEEQKLSEDVKRFRQLFPDVDASGIPETVWQDIGGGIPLPYAYALYLAAGAGDKGYAEKVNTRNSEGALPPVNAYGDEGEITMEEVEAMSPEAVKKSFPMILRSLNKWKI